MAQGTSARVASSRESLRFVEGAVLTKKNEHFICNSIGDLNSVDSQNIIEYT